MRDSSLEQYIAELDYRLFGTVSPDYLYATVMDSSEARAIQSAAHFAFAGRWGEAEQRRMVAGYDGLGLIDNGPVGKDTLSPEWFRNALDSDDSDQ